MDNKHCVIYRTSIPINEDEDIYVAIPKGRIK